MSSSRSKSKIGGRAPHALEDAASTNPPLPPSVGDDFHAGFQGGQAARDDIQNVALFQPSVGSDASQLEGLGAQNDPIERGSALRSAHPPQLDNHQQNTRPNSIVSEQHSAPQFLAPSLHHAVTFVPGNQPNSIVSEQHSAAPPSEHVDPQPDAVAAANRDSQRLFVSSSNFAAGGLPSPPATSGGLPHQSQRHWKSPPIHLTKAELAASNAQVTSYAVQRQPARSKQSRADMLEARRILTLQRDVEAAESKRLRSGHFDKDERKAIRSAHNVAYEVRSQDSNSPGPRTAHGYSTKDKFVTDDHSEGPSELNTTSTTDSDGSIFLPSETDSDESSNAQATRAGVISLVRRKFDTFPVDSLPSETSVTLKVRTSRSRYVEMTINCWLSSARSLPDIPVMDEDVCNLLKIFSVSPQEALIEIYKIWFHVLRPVSSALYVFLYRCLIRYLPDQKCVFKRVHVKLTPAGLAPTAHLMATNKTESKKKPKPTVPKPTVQNIHDIVYVCGTFANNYRRYVYDYQQSNYEHCSLFACLSPDQQVSLAGLATLSTAEVELLDTEAQLDIFRSNFGIKSSAECIAELSALKFRGNALDPADWSAFHIEFLAIINRAPRNVRPPEFELAKRFVYACPLLLLRADVQARKPTSHTMGLETIIGRLNDPGFLRSVAQQKIKPDVASAGIRPNRDPTQRTLAFPNRINPAPPIYNSRGEILQGDRRGNSREFNASLAQAQHRSDAIMSNSLAAASSSPPGLPLQSLALTPQRPPLAQPTVGRGRYSPCGRCGKSDHPVEACISKHDANNLRLAPLSDEVYGKHKAAYYKLKEQAKAAVDAEASPQTSDSEADVYEDEASFDCDCVCELDTSEFLFNANLSPFTDVAPAPRLVGVEPNPGPLSKKSLRCIAKHRHSVHNKVSMKCELLAFVLFNNAFVNGLSTTTVPSALAHSTFTTAALGVSSVTLVLLFFGCTWLLATRYTTANIDNAPPSPQTMPTSFRFNISPDVACFWVFPVTLCFVLAARLVGIEPNPGPSDDSSSPYGAIVLVLLVAAFFTAWGSALAALPCTVGRGKYSPCSRCGKSEHTEEACISKHDANHLILAPLPDEIYIKHKAAYCKLRNQARAADAARQSTQATNLFRSPAVPPRVPPCSRCAPRPREPDSATTATHVPQAPVFRHVICNTTLYSTRFRADLSADEVRFYTFYSDDITVYGRTRSNLHLHVQRYHAFVQLILRTARYPGADNVPALHHRQRQHNSYVMPALADDSDSSAPGDREASMVSHPRLRSSVDHIPPAPRLVGVEPNPGPPPRGASTSDLPNNSPSVLSDFSASMMYFALLTITWDLAIVHASLAIQQMRLLSDRASTGGPTISKFEVAADGKSCTWFPGSSCHSTPFRLKECTTLPISA
jgi:hypothetical protein